MLLEQGELIGRKIEPRSAIALTVRLSTGFDGGRRASRIALVDALGETHELQITLDVIERWTVSPKVVTFVCDAVLHKPRESAVVEFRSRSNRKLDCRIVPPVPWLRLGPIERHGDGARVMLEFDGAGVSSAISSCDLEFRTDAVEIPVGVIFVKSICGRFNGK